MAVYTRTDTPIAGNPIWPLAIVWNVQSNSPTSIILLNNDLTLTVYTGTTFNLVNGIPTSGTLNTMTRFASDGVTQLEQLSGLDVSLVELYYSLDGVGLVLSGDDTMTGGALGDIIYGLGGDDDINGNAGADTLYGGEGDDRLSGSGGSDTIYGEAGNDIIAGGGGTLDTLDGGDGFDTLNYTTSTDAVTVNLADNTASGGFATGDVFSNFEAVFGSAFNDTLTGGDAHERFRGGDGVDTIDGGGGPDEADFASSPNAVIATFTGGGTLVVADDGFGNAEAYISIEHVRGSANGDTFTGSNDDERFRGLDGIDTMNGGGGVDLLDYSNDEAFGGLLGVSVDLTTNTAIDGFGNADVISNFESVRGTRFADFLTGNSLANVLEGGDGNDVLDGRFGIDQQFGGAGNDTYYVDTYLDEVYEDVGGGIQDLVLSSATYALTPGQEVEVVAVNGQATTTAITLIGNEFGQQLIGNNGNNVLAGGFGVDSFVGYGGNDIYVVDDAAEQITEAAGQGTDAVYTTVSYTLAAGLSIERLVAAPLASTNVVDLTGNELGQVIVGNNGVNTNYGGAGNDSIYGMGGNDFIEGAEGNDSLYGGTGVDRFIFRESLGTASGIDRIYDMTSVDNIVVDALAVSSLTSLTANQFRLGTAAGDADDRIIYDATSGVFWFDPDGTGAQAAILFGVINGAPGGVDHSWFELM